MQSECLVEKRNVVMKLRQLSAAGLLAVILAGCGHDFTDAQYVERAKDAMDKGDLRAGVIELKNAIGKNSENAEARWLLGKAYLKVGNGAAAEKELERAKEFGIPEDVLAPSLAQAKLLQGEYQAVLALAHERNELSKEENAALVSVRGDAYLGLGDYGRASEEYKRALTLAPQFGDALIGQANVALAQNRLEDARELVQGVLKTNSKSGEAWSVLGEIERREEHIKEAIAAYTKAIHNRSNNAGDRINRALLNIALEQYDAASDDIKILKKIGIRDPGVSFAEGLLHYARNEFSSAQTSFEQALATAPNYELAQLYLGTTHFVLGHLEQAQQYLSQYLEHAQDSISARELLAATYLRLKQPAAALKALAPVLGPAQSNAKVLALAAEASMQSKQYSQATAFLERAASTDPDDANLRTQLGASRLQTGETDRGIADLESAVKLDSDNSKGSALLVVSYMSKGELNKAAEAAQAWQKSQPDNPVPYNMAGFAYLQQKQYAKARESFEQAVQKKPDFFPAIVNIARVDVQENHISDAKKRLESILEQSQYVPAMLALANLAAAKGDDGEAVSWLTRASNVEPSAMQPRRALVAHYLRRKDTDAALDAARKTKSDNPQAPWAWDLLAKTEMAAGHSDEALDVYREMVRRSPASAWARYELGLAQISAGDVTGGRASLAKSLQLQPGYQEPQLALILTDLRAKEFDQAAQRAERMQAQHPNMPAGYVVEGDVRMAQGRFQQASASYEQAFKLKPNNLLVMKLHLALTQAGDADGAADTVRSWLADHPEDTGTRLYLAAVYKAAGKLDKAIQEYETVLGHDEKNIAALNNLALLYDAKGDARAAETAEKAYRDHPNNPLVMDTYGWMLTRSGDREQGLELLRKAAAGAPGAGEIGYHLAVALSQSGHKDEARALLEKTLKAAKNPFPGQTQAEKLLETLR